MGILNDEMYSMNEYSYSGKGIGGNLKKNPEDFMVTECDPITHLPINLVQTDETFGGLFLVGQIEKRNTDHSRMIRELGKLFKVKENDISTGGIKDAKAITIQLFSIYNPINLPADPTNVTNNIKISRFRNRRERIFPGSMGGNYFQIIIRDTSDLISEKIEEFHNKTKNGILNFFGYQRFGADRPISADMGKLLNGKQFEEAINLFLGKEYISKNQIFRNQWMKTKNAAIVLETSEFIPQLEYKVLKYLKYSPEDFKGAINKIPEFLRNLFNSAFISKLTNHYLSLRGLDGLYSGERKVGNNIEIAQPSRKWNKPLNEFWELTFEQQNLKLNDLINTRHTSRMLKLHYYNWNYKILDNQTLKVNFRLDTGCYATTLLRELMKSSPEKYI